MGLVQVLYSLCGCVCYMLQVRIQLLHLKTILEFEKKGNPPCNAEDNMRAGLLVIEAKFRGY